MREPPPIPPTHGQIRFVIDRLIWTNALRYFLPVSATGPLYLRTDLTADRAPRTHEQCLLALVTDGYVTEDEPATQCRLPVPERGRVALVPLALTPRGRQYLRTLTDPTATGNTPSNNRQH